MGSSERNSGGRSLCRLWMGDRVEVNWQQIETKEHKQGMRLECSDCQTVEYFGDSPAGDLALYKARDEHKCK